MLQYGFMLRAVEAGMIIAVIAPVIGMFLVLKRYSLIADTLSHVSFAGIALGIFLGLNPILTAVVASIIAALGIERLRQSKKIFGESALSLFLSGSLALALVILGLAHGINMNIFIYLFGSIVTVTAHDVRMMALVAILVLTAVALLYRQLLYVTFDEDGAKVSGVPVETVNMIFMIAAALTVALSIQIVGVLLISALIVIPVVAALQLKAGFKNTLLAAEVISIFSVLAGIISSFYLGLPTGGAIVLIMLSVFAVVYTYKR